MNLSGHGTDHDFDFLPTTHDRNIRYLMAGGFLVFRDRVFDPAMEFLEAGLLL
jgi:hypothetical protein